MASGVKLNIIDTPGYADFFGEVRAACSVVDSVVVVVSAVEGIEAQTEAAWELASELGLPRFVFVNKLDREQARFDRTLAALVERFGAGIAPLELPIVGESGLVGIADLLTDTALFYDGGTARPGPIPEDLEATEHEVREQLVEGIVVGDDDLMVRYLDEDIPSAAELEDALAGGVTQGVVFPVICGSAATGMGIDRLASLLAEIAPAPDARPPIEVRAGDSTHPVPCDPAGQPLTRVFKTMSDPYVGKVSLMRVLSGTIRPDSVLTNSRTHKRGASPRPRAAPGQAGGAGRRSAGGRHRGRPQARRGQHRRHAGTPRAPPCSSHCHPTSRRCSRSACGRSRRATRTS